MKKSSLLKLGATLLMSVTLLASCGGNTQGQPTGGDDPTTVTSTTQEEAKSKIASITAVQGKEKMKVGARQLLTSLYTVNAVKGETLKAADKICTYSISNETVLSISGKQLVANAAGEADLVVTSSVDETKTISIHITVKDIVFDRSVSTINGSNDMEAELPADGGYVETTGMTSDTMYFANSVSTKSYVETTISIKEVLSSELFPKFGVVFSTKDLSQTQGSTTIDNEVYFFLDAAITSEGNTQWSHFGVCEVANSGNWAWNPGVQQTMARHRDNCYSVPTPITYETEFSIGVARDGFDFHVFVNGTYVYSMTTLEDLFGEYVEGEIKPINSYVGIFEFQSRAVFSKYSFTIDATQVDEKINSISTKNFIGGEDQPWDPER